MKTCERRKREAPTGVHDAGSDNLSAWVANEGWTITEPDTNRLYNYTSQEGMAKFLRKGIWNGTFDPPAEWRRGQQAGERP